MQRMAVLTGDIVKSTDLSPADLTGLMSGLEQTCAAMADWSHNTPGAYFSRRGGDGWQIALLDPQYALRAALILQATVKSHPSDTTTRIAISVGDGTVPDTRDLNAAHGPAFTESGRALAALRESPLMAHAKGGTDHACAVLASHIAEGWTPSQARVSAAALVPNAPTQSAIAEALGVTRQSVNQTLRAAGFGALSEALDAIETQKTEAGP